MAAEAYDVTPAASQTKATEASSRPVGDAAPQAISADAFGFPKEVGSVAIWTSITATREDQVIIGLCRTNEPAYVAQFDDASRRFAATVCVDTAIRDTGDWKVRQAKIHSQLWQLSDGWVYGGTHLSLDSEAKEYPGGHWFRYDPKSHKIEDLGLAMAHEGLIALQPDEPRGCLYALTYPGAYLLRFDLASRQTQVLGKTSRDDQVNRVFFVLGPGTVYTNQVYSPASQPGGIYSFDAETETERIDILPLYRKTRGGYIESLEKEGPELYNYWLAGVTDPARTVAYTTGYYSGRFLSLRLDGKGALVIRDHGLTVPNAVRTGLAGPYSQGMCWSGGQVYFTVSVSSGKPLEQGETRLLRYDAEQDRIVELGTLQTRDGSGVCGCTAMACTKSGDIYLVGSTGDSAVLLRIDRRLLDCTVAGGAPAPSSP